VTLGIKRRVQGNALPGEAHAGAGKPARPAPSAAVYRSVATSMSTGPGVPR
jgi:hypothetical protein